MTPVKVYQHFETMHAHCKEKKKEYFVHKSGELFNTKKDISQTVNEKAAEASYMVITQHWQKNLTQQLRSLSSHVQSKWLCARWKKIKQNSCLYHPFQMIWYFEELVHQRLLLSMKLTSHIKSIISLFKWMSQQIWPDLLCYLYLYDININCHWKKTYLCINLYH